MQLFFTRAKLVHGIISAVLALTGSVAMGGQSSTDGVSIAKGASAHGAAARQQALREYIRRHGGQPSPTHSADDGDLLGQQAQYDFERTAPAGFVSGQPLVSAAQQAATMPSIGGAWQEFTNRPYNSEPSNYTDPFWGNEGAGFALVGGRVTALTETPDASWFAGAADGGVWRSRDSGQHWTPVFDSMPTLSIGALAVDPLDGSLWVGTGEANTSQDSYSGTGVYRSIDDGATWQRIGDDNSGNNPLAAHTVFRLTFDQNGNAYAATNDGLWRLAAGTAFWVEVLAPAGEPQNPPYPNQVTDVTVVPGSGGTVLIAAVGWRSAALPTNGFYQSTDGGNTWSQITLAGDINAGDIGRTTFAYSQDGSRLYAIVESPTTTGLQGIFVSVSAVRGSSASVAGPWTLIANASTLANSGSAAPTFGNPGVQAWYNQDLAVDPSNPLHLYAGLEEVYESNDGGTTWITASPYWNYNFACDFSTPPTCPNVTHPDQHAIMIADGQVVIGNDGGVYSRPLSDVAEDGNWVDLNATLRNLQYYDARAGYVGNSSSGVAVWGGLQDNGSSWLSSGSSQMVEPAGGDGFDVIVDPQNANRIVGEYVDGTMYSSIDGGHSFSDFISPTCAAQAVTGLPGGPRPDCDPAARFVTPLVPDLQSKNVWLTGGEFVWVAQDGWNTACTVAACSWRNVFDTGAGNAITALSSANGGAIIYAAWVAGGGNPGPAFASGIATNYGGVWHQVNMTGLPSRYIAGVTVDIHNPAHAYAVFNGFSRRWIPGGGVGHVFETNNGGQTWTDISGNLPDIPGDALVMGKSTLALATDQGVFTAPAGHGAATSWSRFGTGLPNASVNDLTVGPDGNIYAATHGRGVWRIAFN
jgi:hypothetical protein